MEMLQYLINKTLEVEQLKRERDNYNLGYLIEDLSKYPENACVEIKPFNLYPTGFCSYRGYYSDLSIDYTLDEYSGLSCGQLLEKAKECVGKVFQGYKGGDFKMTKHSVIWLANYSRTTDAILTGVKDRFGDGSFLELTWKIAEESK